MRITPKQYAVLLYETTKSAKGAELARHVKEFIQLLARNRALALLPRIERAYVDYYNAQENVTDVEVTTAQEIGKKVVIKIQRVVAGFQPAHDAKERTLKRAPTIEIKTYINPMVLGGARIRAGDYLIDDTLKARLAQLKQAMYAR